MFGRTMLGVAQLPILNGVVRYICAQVPDDGGVDSDST